MVNREIEQGVEKKRIETTEYGTENREHRTLNRKQRAENREWEIGNSEQREKRTEIYNT